MAGRAEKDKNKEKSQYALVSSSQSDRYLLPPLLLSRVRSSSHKMPSYHFSSFPPLPDHVVLVGAKKRLGCSLNTDLRSTLWRSSWGAATPAIPALPPRPSIRLLYLQSTPPVEVLQSACQLRLDKRAVRFAPAGATVKSAHEYVLRAVDFNETVISSLFARRRHGFRACLLVLRTRPRRFYKPLRAAALCLGSSTPLAGLLANSLPARLLPRVHPIMHRATHPRL